MPREEKHEWFARFEEITGPVQQSSKDEVENVLLQSITKSIFEELNDDSTITTDTPISGEQDSYLSRLRAICHLDDAADVIPGRERTDIEIEEPTKAGELREIGEPLVVIEDEHGLKSMHWRPEPTAKSDETRNRETFWILVHKDKKQSG